MKLIGKCLAATLLISALGLGFTPKASAQLTILTQPAFVDTGMVSPYLVAQPGVINTSIALPSVIGTTSACNTCGVLTQPAVIDSCGTCGSGLLLSPGFYGNSLYSF